MAGTSRPAGSGTVRRLRFRAIGLTLLVVAICGLTGLLLGPWGVVAALALLIIGLVFYLLRTLHHTILAIDSIAERGWDGLGDLLTGPGIGDLTASLRNLAVVTEQREHALKDVIQRERVKSLELEMYSQQLEEVTERLESTNEELEAFTYSASHDLAVPLRTIEAYAALLLEGEEGELPVEARDSIARIHRSAHRLRRLIADLLVLSRLRDPSDADVERVSLGEMVGEIVSSLESEMPENARVSVEGTLPVVEAPSERIRQVLQNLIQNGLKYNHSAVPAVTVNGWAEGALAIVRVTDNGIGIPDHDRDRVFELFTRLSDDVPGTGAGLAIARRALRSLGGELWIESSSETGSIFAFAVPLQYRRREPRPSWQAEAVAGMTF